MFCPSGRLAYLNISCTEICSITLRHFYFHFKPSFFRLDVITKVRDIFESLHPYEMLLKNFKAKLFIFSFNIRWKLIHNLIIHSFSQNEHSCKTFIFIFYIKIIYFEFIFHNVNILIRLFLNSHYENDLIIQSTY